MKNTIKLALTVGSLLTASLFAAQDGELVHGSDTSISSEGNLDVSLEVLYAIQVNKLNDINLGTFKSGLDSDVSGQDDFCVFTNAEAYAIGFFGGNGTGRGDSFVMANVDNSNLTIPYDIKMSTIDVANNKTFLKDVENSRWIQHIGEVRNRKNCEMDDLGYKPNVNIEVSVKEGIMLDAIPGSYKDTVTIIACPE
jgi:spore coat protein U-like protein